LEAPPRFELGIKDLQVISVLWKIALIEFDNEMLPIITEDIQRVETHE